MENVVAGRSPADPSGVVGAMAADIAEVAVGCARLAGLAAGAPRDASPAGASAFAVSEAGLRGRRLRGWTLRVRTDASALLCEDDPRDAEAGEEPVAEMEALRPDGTRAAGAEWTLDQVRSWMEGEAGAFPGAAGVALAVLAESGVHDEG